MQDITRNIGFYFISLELNSNRTEVLPAARLKEILAYVASLGKRDRRRVWDTDSYYFLSEVEGVEGREDIDKLIFKRAKYGSRPPLVHKETLEERDNPKELTEGERVLTHIVLRYFQDEVVALLESVAGGVTIGRIEHYLNDYAARFHESRGEQKNYTISHQIVATENFTEALSKLNRVAVGKVFIEKQYLGSEYLNLSNRTRDVREQIEIQVKAQRKKSIEDFIEDVYAVFQSADSKVLRIRAEGFNQESQPVTIDTDILRKTEPLNFSPNILTGELRSSEVFGQLVEMIQQFDP
jgi:hypothetical protein